MKTLRGWFWTTGILLAGCGGDPAPAPAPAEAPVTITIEYGSEKEAWLSSALSAFDATRPRTSGGRPIVVEAHAGGSGAGMESILAGTTQPTVYSPASTAYLSLLNEAWLHQAGHTAPVAPAGEPLVLSPIVVGMWEPMARSLGWPEKKLGWSDLLTIATDPGGWGSHGHPEWGRFKLAHTHPGLSNSGLLAVLAEAYAGAGKPRGLTVDDLQDPKVRSFAQKVESTLVHYGTSTSFLQKKMVERGPSYVSAAVLYENLVVEANTKGAPMPIVCLYPREGTFWSDHPYATLDAPWVTPEQKDAAKVLETFLHANAQQVDALAKGFRPADPGIAITAPLDAAHGVDPKEPQNLLDIPDAATLSGVLDFWEATKKTADVTLVFDKSGSMQGPPLAEAKVAAQAFLDDLGDRDEVSLLFFDNRVADPETPAPLGGGGREAQKQRIEGALAEGGTALYDAIDVAYDAAAARAEKDPSRIHAIVVMTDGRDASSRRKLEELTADLGKHPEAPVKVFTIGYGDQADPTILAAIAEAGKGSTATGSLADIRAVFSDMAAFF